MTAALAGTWQLLSMRLLDDAAGTEKDLWGERPIGLLSYSAGGRMSAVIAAADGTRSVAYAGTWRPVEGGVVHHVEVATDSSWIGTDQPRSTDLDGDLLTITGATPEAVGGAASRTLVLVWQRVE